ncbi:vomeronasal 1 receptor cavPorV1R632 [Cavia porcellus]|uniref:vomeronasal 1 receptor cavPorV1R632 n=1 Tax=Cavia porcellus TaxID=10141 RepID=UPI0001CF7416|nr:vomeronasal 1 receptor cavPorV1R632 [Cavia porcellus]
MAASEVVVGVIFLSQTVIGVLGNLSLLYQYFFLYFTGCRLKCTDLILKHLIVANLLTLLCRGVPHTIEAFGWQVSLGNMGCKLLIYLHRVGRGGSIGTICFLSVFQAITISPKNYKWAEIKMKASKYAGSTLCLIWVLYSLVNVVFLMYITGNSTNKNHTGLKSHGYCSSIRHDKTADLLYIALLSFPDALCLGLMLCTSSSMVSILYKHRQQMRDIHRTNVSLASSPESRATKHILFLVSFYVCFYTLSCIFQAFMSFTYNPNLFLVYSSAIVAGCFPAVSPLLFLRCESRVSRFCFDCIRNGKAPFNMTNG